MRGLAGVALVLALSDPVALLARSWSASAHECTDHVCACARSARQACHESEGRSEGMQAACNHDAPGSLAASIPALPVPESRLAAPLRAEDARMSPAARNRPGYSRIDSPPPRSL